MSITDPSALHPAWVERFNAQDLDGIMSFAEPKGTFVPQPGLPVTGSDNLAAQRQFLAFGSSCCRALGPGPAGPRAAAPGRQRLGPGPECSMMVRLPLPGRDHAGSHATRPTLRNASPETIRSTPTRIA